MSRPEEIAPPELVRSPSLSCSIANNSFTATPKLKSTPQSVYLSVSRHGLWIDRPELTSSTRVQNIQAQMTHRALELLALPEDESAFLLDIGCGSGLSGEILDEEGHQWVGVDIAPSMLGKLVLRLL